MNPFDPRLIVGVTSTRGFLIRAAAIGIVQTAAIIAQAIYLAELVVAVFVDHQSLSYLWGQTIAVAIAFLVRAVCAWASEVNAQRGAAQVKSELRRLLFAKIVRLGPLWQVPGRPIEMTTLATRGVAALDNYFSRFLPSLVLAALTPLAIALVILRFDWLAFVIVLCTVPLIPFFMALIGKLSDQAAKRQWSTLQALSQHFNDLIAGLPTLRIYGRAKTQFENLRQTGERYLAATMSVLKVAFLSALALELVSTISVAMLAVSIGLRLVDGRMDLLTGLTVLLLAPDVYQPLRAVGLNFHAATDGVEAAGQVFAVLDEPEPPQPKGEMDITPSGLVLSGVTVGYPGAFEPVLHNVNLELRPGTMTALVGPSGSGKTTLLYTLLGFITAQAGTISTDNQLVTNAADLRGHIAYLAQRPWLPEGPLSDAITAGRNMDSNEVDEALAAVGLFNDNQLPLGAQTVLSGESGGLSQGQARRVALARTLATRAPLVLMDEPTAALDTDTEELVVRELTRLRDFGATVLVVAHRPALMAAADAIIDVRQWSA